MGYNLKIGNIFNKNSLFFEIKIFIKFKVYN